MANIAGLGLAALLAWTLAAQVALAQEDDDSVWLTASGCQVWIHHKHETLSTAWQGGCSGGKTNGEGTLTWKIKGDADTIVTESYSGTWKNGKQQGKGRYSDTEGNRYEGEFEDGKLHGLGVLVRASGGRYEGEWKDNMKHGRGTLYFANGDECEGDWREGRLLGAGRFWRSSEARWMKCYDDGNMIQFTE